jgi:hypothetical protein
MADRERLMSEDAVADLFICDAAAVQEGGKGVRFVVRAARCMAT